MKRLWLTWLAAAAMALPAATSEGSILLFQKQDGSGLTGNETTADLLAYGDRVTATSQGGYGYGIGAEGTTPNIVASYKYTMAYGGPGYGDVSNTLYRYRSGLLVSDFLEITLTADAGYNVRLHSFDIAAWNGEEDGIDFRTISTLEVRNQANQVLYTESNHVVNYGDPPSHDTFSFPTPLQGQSLTIRFNEDTANRFLNGIDNIVFSQVLVPEPMSTACMASLGCLFFIRRRR